MNEVVRLVAARELRQRVRSKAFLVVTVVIALLGLLAVVVPEIVSSMRGREPVEIDTPTVGSVGAAPAHVVLALERAFGVAPDLVEHADEDAARAAVEAGEVDVVVVDDGARLLVPGASGPFSTGAPPRVAEALGIARAMADEGAGERLVATALDAGPAMVEVVLTGTGVDPATGAGRFAVAYAGAMFLYFTLLFFASLIVNGVIEEKGSRVVELLLPAVSARQLMAGKVLGLGIVGAAQAVVIAAPALIALYVLHGDTLPPSLGVSIVSVVVAFVLGYSLYAGVTAGLAALVSRVEDSQVALFPLYAVLVGAFLASFPVLNAPDTTLARVVTFVPFTAPFVVPVRIALVDLPLWQAGLAAVIVAVTAVGLTRLAARIYEGSILRSGARVKLRTAWRGARG